MRLYLLKRKPVAPPRPLFTAPVTVASNDAAVSGYNTTSGLVYASSGGTGHYLTSPDGVTWTDRTYSPSVYTPSLTAWEFDESYQYAYSSTGKIYRAGLLVFNSWTDISVPSPGTHISGRPGSLCALGSGVLIYGNYTSAAGDGAHIWRSTDAGANWTEVLTYSNGKHVHAIRYNAASGNLWASLGDSGFDGTGLHKSTDQGVTWQFMSGPRYGIDMVFLPANSAHEALVVLEGDGLREPNLVAFPENAVAGTATYPLVDYVGGWSAAGNTIGTARGLGLCPTGDLVYFLTPESGVAGSNAGIFAAAGPSNNVATLIKDTTGAEPVTVLRTVVINGLVLNYQWSFPMPQFETTARQNSLRNSLFAGGGSVPTNWGQPGGTGTSTATASTLTQFSDSASAYTHVATAQRPFFQATPDASVAANSQYTLSVYIESITGTVAANNVLTIVSAPAGSTLTYYLDDVYMTAATAVTAGRLRVTLRTAGTSGTIQRRVGLGGTSNSTGTLVFSRPEFEARDFAGPFCETA